MGDPLPEKFGKLLGQSATKYWIGVRFELAGGYQAVTLLEPSVPRIELHVFSASGKHVHRRVMAQLQTRHVVGSGAWRTGHPPLSGRSTETVVKEDGTIVTESREVLELTRLGGAKLRSLCSILAFEAVEKWGADGKFTLQGSQVTQSRDALDGCSHDSPFVEVEMADDIAWHILQKWKALRIKEIADRGKSAEIWIPMNSVHGSGDHYIARVLEQIKSSASCEYWDYVPFGSYTVGWSPKIQGDGRVAPQRRFGPGCCPEGACPHENQPNALQLALVDAVERKNAKVIAKWIHPVKRCEVRIHDGSYISEGKVTPGDSHMVFNGELRMALHGIFAGFGCDDEFKDGLARCGWGFSSDSWSTYWEMIDGKPYLTRYEYSGH